MATTPDTTRGRHCTRVVRVGSPMVRNEKIYSAPKCAVLLLAPRKGSRDERAIRPLARVCGAAARDAVAAAALRTMGGGTASRCPLTAGRHRHSHSRQNRTALARTIASLRGAVPIRSTRQSTRWARGSRLSCPARCTRPARASTSRASSRPRCVARARSLRDPSAAPCLSARQNVHRSSSSLPPAPRPPRHPRYDGARLVCHPPPLPRPP